MKDPLDEKVHDPYMTETSDDLLRYAQALNFLKTTFPEDTYSFRNAASELASEIKRRVTKPEEPEDEE